MSSFCPACGSDSIETIKSKHTLPIVYGSDAEYDEILEKCLICGESGDFSGANDEQIVKALEIAKKESAVVMLEYLSNLGIKMSYMERALELPTRTMARWKGGELSAATLALLRIIRTFPWILEVADAHFDQSVAKYRVIEEAGHMIHDWLKPHDTQTQIAIIEDNEKVVVHTRITFNTPGFSERLMQPRIQQMAIVGGYK